MHALTENTRACYTKFSAAIANLSKTQRCTLVPVIQGYLPPNVRSKSPTNYIIDFVICLFYM